MRVLITGAAGQLGRALAGALRTMRSPLGPVPAPYAGATVDACASAELDITDAAAVEARFAARGPYDVVFNCAALTDVDGCEQDPSAAVRVNAEGPRNVARACAAHGGKIVQVSTDYVFSGNEPAPRAEDDPTGPVSVYGRTKLSGERVVAQEAPRHFIVRTAWLYGDGHNFVRTMLRLGRERAEVRAVDDQRGNPTCADDLSFELLRLALTDGFGVYHCTNEGTCSWAELAAAVMEEAGLSCRVVPVTTEQYRRLNPGAAPRPAFSSLENARLAATIGNGMRPWREALRDYVERELR